MQSCCSCLRCRISCSTAPGITCTSSAHRLHVIWTSSACRLHVISTLSACHLRMRICCPHQDTSSAHCRQAICITPHGHRGPELSITVTGICYWIEFVTGMLNCFISGSCKWFARKSVLLVFSACQIWTLFTSHLHMYMSSAYYLSIWVLCAYYLQWSLISSFLTGNANVIYMSSVVLFIYPIMYNLVSAHCLHRRTLSMLFACYLHK